MQKPPYLKKGSTIAITCPSGFLATEVVEEAKRNIEAWGFKVVIGKTFGLSDNYFSAPDNIRTADLQKFLDDESVDAILMGRGGYGMSRIIDQLDFTKFLIRPKWIIGFSDITVIHSHIQSNFGIASLHAPMCSSFTKANMGMDFMKMYKEVLMGKPAAFSLKSNKHNITGKATGMLVGGNLAMLSHMTGSQSAMNCHNKILFIEDIGEHLYNIDRMLYNLKRSGAFDNLLGVICGGFTDLEDTTRPFGQDIYQIILGHFKDFGIPLVFDFPSGHIDQNFPLVLGNVYTIKTNKRKTEIFSEC